MVIGSNVMGVSFFEFAELDEAMFLAYFPEAVARVFAIFVFIMLFHKSIKTDALNFKNNFLVYRV